MDYKSKPSVTDIIGLLDKPALMKWANKIGLQGISLDDYRAKSKNSGLSLHKQIEEWIANKTPFADAAFQSRFESFFKDKPILESEKSFVHPLFVGRMDVKFKTAKGICIADFKSNQRAVYIENRLQLSAYRMAEGCDLVAIISIPDMTMLEVPISDFAPYERAITILCELYNLKKKL